MDLQHLSTAMELLAFFTIVAAVVYLAMRIRKNAAYRFAIGDRCRMPVIDPGFCVRRGRDWRYHWCHLIFAEQGECHGIRII